MRYWIGVASKNHVQRGIEGGFAQLGHGKKSALHRMQPGDWIVYYSPKTALEDGEPVQAFTAIGQIAAREPYIGDMGPDFKPWRRDVNFLPARDTPIQPLLEHLSFIQDVKRWGYPFHRGHFEMTPDDFQLISNAMGVQVVKG